MVVLSCYLLMFTYAVSDRRTVTSSALVHARCCLHNSVFCEGCQYVKATSEWTECCYVLHTLSTSLGYFVFHLAHTSNSVFGYAVVS